MPTERNTPFSLTPEEFRKIGYYLVDSLAQFYDTIGEKPVTTGEKPNEIKMLLGTATLPETGLPAADIMQKAVSLLFSHSLFNGHPKFLGYITSSPTPIGALADLLGSAINPNVGANILSPMATAIERQTIQWLAEFIGVSPGYGGIMVSGGNMANFTAFIAARTKVTSRTILSEDKALDQNLIVYCSKATHTWIEKAAFFFGIGKKGIRWIEQDDDGKLKIDQLELAILHDIKNGFTPMMVVGNAGDVSTGVVDNLKAIGAICNAYQTWFHIDGAYGLPAAALPECKELFVGISEADSIAIDPHKWLYSPLEAGCTLVKDPKNLVDSFSTHPVYYNFDDPENQAHNFHEYGFQNSRGFRALKVWAAMLQVGRNGYVAMIREDIALAELFFRLANEHNELEAVTCNLSIATLRYIPLDMLDEGKDNEVYWNKLNEELLNSIQQGGKMFLSNAVVKGKYCLRGCIVNFRTSERDIHEMVEIIVQEGRRIHQKLSRT